MFLSCCILSDIGYVLTYFRFPRDPYKRKIWLTALGINWEPPKTATVCSHFTESDFENWTTNRILKESALPGARNIDQFVSDPNPVSEEPTPTSTYSEEPKANSVSEEPTPTPTYSEVPKVCHSKFLSKSYTNTI